MFECSGFIKKHYFVVAKCCCNICFFKGLHLLLGKGLFVDIHDPDVGLIHRIFILHKEGGVQAAKGMQLHAGNQFTISKLRFYSFYGRF
ncbi:hypothetical protein D9M68_895370 [compost metagenome]